MRIAIIGGGVMGEAILAALLEKGLAKREEIVVTDVAPARLATLHERYQVRTMSENTEAVIGAEVVLLAVKPQSLAEVMGGLKGRLSQGQVMLSIVAGARIETLRRSLGHEAIVRVMPNTPAQIGQGISVWTATKEVSAEQREVARSLLQALGKEIYVAEEKLLDMATAVSGSGPAYVFLFLEALIDAGVHIGFSRDVAQELALQTILGSALFAQATGKHPAELRNMVTSPGGTTAEGLLRLEQGGLRAMVAEAIIAAYEKSQLLGGSSTK